MRGATSVSFKETYFTNDGVEYPTNLAYPDALQIIFDYIERHQLLNLSEMLDRAAFKSIEIVKEKKWRKKKRTNFIKL